jgi:hypothetical protein
MGGCPEKSPADPRTGRNEHSFKVDTPTKPCLEWKRSGHRRDPFSNIGKPACKNVILPELNTHYTGTEKSKDMIHPIHFEKSLS